MSTDQRVLLLMIKIVGTYELNPKWAMCTAAKSWGSWPDRSPSQTPGHVYLTKVKHTWTQLVSEPDFSPVGVLLWRVRSRRWTQTSKTTRDSAIKTPGLLLCLAFQFKWFYGRPDTISQFPEWHPFVFFSSFCETTLLTKGPAEMISFIGFPRRGRTGLTVIWRDPLFLPGNLPPSAPLLSQS